MSGGASFGSGFASGVGGGFAMGAAGADMAVKAQAMEEAKMQKFLGGIQLFQKDPGAGEVYLKELMPTLGIEEPRQKTIIDALKKSGEEQIAAFTKMAGEGIAAGVPAKSILNTPFHEWPTLIKSIGELSERRVLDESVTKFPMGGAQQQGSAPATFGQARGASIPVPAGSAIPAPSGSMVPPPSASPGMAVPGRGAQSDEGTVAALTPNRGAVNIAGIEVPLNQAQGVKALEAADRFDVLQKRAEFLESKGQAKAADEVRKAAEREKMNAHITLTPQQASRVGFKPGAIVQVNAADGTLKQVQEGHDTFSIVTDPKILSQFKPGSVIMRSGLTGDLMVKQQGENAFKTVNPTDYNQPADAIVQEEILPGGTKKVHVTQAGGRMETQLTPEQVRERGLDPTTPWFQKTTGEVVTPDKLTTERAKTAGESKADIDALVETRKAISTGQRMIDTANVIQKLAPSAAGLTSNARIVASRIFDAFGDKEAAAKTRGAEATALRGFLNQSVESLASNLEGRISGRTMQFLKQAQGSIYDTPEGLEILADALKASGQDILDTNKMAETHYRDNGKSLSATDKEGKNYYDKLREKPGGMLTPEMDEKLSKQEADFSIKDMGIRGVTASRISQANANELDALHKLAQQGKLNPQQIALAKARQIQLEAEGKKK